VWRKNTVHVPTPYVSPTAPADMINVWPPLVGPTVAASPIANAGAVPPAIGDILPGIGYDFGTAPLHHTALAPYTALLGEGFLPHVAFGAPLGPWAPVNSVLSTFLSPQWMCFISSKTKPVDWSSQILLSI